ncbi:hypothetical protein, partial [Pseudomonas aeruginosa]|uniref:hypothetical protein n=1 Tax=Pseudomonas aeruginosa TaxID=287 RepID=UPI003981D835
MSKSMLIPAEAKRALPVIQQSLADSLVAVYLHGSAVAAFFKIVVASTVFSGRLFLRLLFLLPLGVECHRSDRRPVACG